jgi:hypothetical protein
MPAQDVTLRNTGVGKVLAAPADKGNVEGFSLVS